MQAEARLGGRNRSRELVGSIAVARARNRAAGREPGGDRGDGRVRLAGSTGRRAGPVLRIRRRRRPARRRACSRSGGRIAGRRPTSRRRPPRPAQTGRQARRWCSRRPDTGPGQPLFNPRPPVVTGRARSERAMRRPRPHRRRPSRRRAAEPRPTGPHRRRRRPQRRLAAAPAAPDRPGRRRRLEQARHRRGQGRAAAAARLDRDHGRGGPAGAAELRAGGIVYVQNATHRGRGHGDQPGSAAHRREPGRCRR